MSVCTRFSAPQIVGKALQCMSSLNYGAALGEGLPPWARAVGGLALHGEVQMFTCR